MRICALVARIYVYIYVRARIYVYKHTNNGAILKFHAYNIFMNADMHTLIIYEVLVCASVCRLAG
jgi:hypothetical protein